MNEPIRIKHVFFFFWFLVVAAIIAMVWQAVYQDGVSNGYVSAMQDQADTDSLQFNAEGHDSDSGGGEGQGATGYATTTIYCVSH